MSRTYSELDDKGALRRRAAELGARQHSSSSRVALATSVSGTDARRRLSRCYAALAGRPKAPDWAAIKRLARFAETAANAAQPSPGGESPDALRRESAFVKAHVVLCEALYRCDLGRTVAALCACAAARGALVNGSEAGPSSSSALGHARDFARRAYEANLNKIPVLFDVDACGAALFGGDGDGAGDALARALGDLERAAAAEVEEPADDHDAAAGDKPVGVRTPTPRRAAPAAAPAGPRAALKTAADFLEWLDARRESGGVLVVLLGRARPALLFARASREFRGAPAPRPRSAKSPHDAFGETGDEPVFRALAARPKQPERLTLGDVHAAFAVHAAAVAAKLGASEPGDGAVRWTTATGGREATYFAAKGCASIAVACVVLEAPAPVAPGPRGARARDRGQASRDAACASFATRFARPFRDATAGTHVPPSLSQYVGDAPGPPTRSGSRAASAPADAGPSARDVARCDAGPRRWLCCSFPT